MSSGETALGGNGGSGGTSTNKYGASFAGNDGSDGLNSACGKGQGHTTRDFGEPSGKPNAGGGGINEKSGYSEGSGGNSPNSGYGGGSSPGWYSGGDGTVLLRFLRTFRR